LVDGISLEKSSNVCADTKTSFVDSIFVSASLFESSEKILQNSKEGCNERNVECKIVSSIKASNIFLSDTVKDPIYLPWATVSFGKFD
jgi:hypothetical protein